MARFEAQYYEGEINERSPEWTVIEWTTVSPNGKSKMGRKIDSFADSDFGQTMAEEMAFVLNREYSFGENI